MCYLLYNIHHFVCPQGQGIMDQAQGTLKDQLQKWKKGELYTPSPKNFILKFFYLGWQGTLCCWASMAS